MRHVAPTEKTSSNARCRKHFKATPHRIAGGVELRSHADKPGIELRAGLSAQVGTRGLAHVSPERGLGIRGGRRRFPRAQRGTLVYRLGAVRGVGVQCWRLVIGYAEGDPS
jgi:hypothetical protein